MGSVTVKLVIMDDSLRTLYSSYEKHFSRPMHALLSSLQTLYKKTGIDRELTGSAVTGSGRELVGKVLGIPSVSEIVSQAVSVSRLCPGARTIVEIGGQDSKFVQLGQQVTSTGEAIIINQRMNAICAAGTGAFLEQQADKLGIPIEDFGEIALQSTHPAFVAGRCAVFAKTDIIHLRQQGIAIPDIAM